jgi:hypothetical protein
VACLALALALAACGEDHASSAASPALAPGAWHDFEGSWTAAGSVHTIALGNGRQASLANLRGTLILGGPSAPGIGFRGDVIAFADSETGMVGRAVWTDERGDEVYSALQGAGPQKGNHVTGTFIGGTGRYAGASGTYEFTWQYVLAAEDGTVQGRATGLKGRVRAGAADPSKAQGTRP